MTFSKTLSLFSAIALSFGLAACGDNGSSATNASGAGNATPAAASNAGGDSLARIKAAGVIRIGVFGDKPPFGYLDANGKTKASMWKSPAIWRKTCSAAQTKSNSS